MSPESHPGPVNVCEAVLSLFTALTKSQRWMVTFDGLKRYPDSSSIVTVEPVPAGHLVGFAAGDEEDRVGRGAAVVAAGRADVVTAGGLPT